MNTYQTQQLHLLHRGRSFHFVSYEGHPADPKLEQSDMPPAWFLMYGGKRRMVFPQVGDTAPAVLARQFGEWLDAQVFDAPSALQSQQPPLPAEANTGSPGVSRASAKAARRAVRAPWM